MQKNSTKLSEEKQVIENGQNIPAEKEDGKIQNLLPNMQKEQHKKENVNVQNNSANSPEKEERQIIEKV